MPEVRVIEPPAGSRGAARRTAARAPQTRPWRVERTVSGESMSTGPAPASPPAVTSTWSTEPARAEARGERLLVTAVGRGREHLGPVLRPDPVRGPVQPGLVASDQHHPRAGAVQQGPGSEADARAAADDDDGGSASPAGSRERTGTGAVLSVAMTDPLK